MRYRCAQARFHEVGGIADIFPAGGGMRTGTADIVADFQQKPAFFTVEGAGSELKWVRALTNIL